MSGNHEILQKAGEDELTRIVAPIILWVLMSCSAVIGRGFGHIEVFILKPVPWLTEVDTALKIPFASGERSRLVRCWRMMLCGKRDRHIPNLVALR